MNARRQHVLHSAVVRIQLSVDGHVFNVAQLGPDFLVLRNPIDYPPANAEVFISIDGDEDRWPVYLADGIKASERKTRTTECLPIGKS
jgi:hypothetical protein